MDDIIEQMESTHVFCRVKNYKDLNEGFVKTKSILMGLNESILQQHLCDCKNRYSEYIKRKLFDDEVLGYIDTMCKLFVANSNSTQDHIFLAYCIDSEILAYVNQ